MVELIVIGILVIFIISLSVWIRMYRKQVQSITEQAKYIRKHETNMLISKQMPNPEIDELVDSLNSLLHEHKKLEVENIRNEQALRQTITNISHDIRTPLTSLDGYFQLIKKCEKDDDARRERYYGVIDERIESLKMILEQLFTFIRLQNEEYVLENERINYSKVVCDVILSYYNDLQERGIEPTLRIPDEQFHIYANPTAIMRVVQNITKNALDHGKRNISIELKKDNDRVILEVSNGCEDGDKIDKERVFDRFYMADESRGGVSTGLGLSIAKLMVDKMNGTIEAYGDDKTFGIRIGFMLA